MFRAVEAHLVDGMPIETAAYRFGVTESAIIHEMEIIDNINDDDYPPVMY